MPLIEHALGKCKKKISNLKEKSSSEKCVFLRISKPREKLSFSYFSYLKGVTGALTNDTQVKKIASICNAPTQVT